MISFDLDLGELVTVLEDMNKKVSVDALANAAKKAMEPVKREMLRLVQVGDTGMLKRSIGLKTRKNPRSSPKTLVRVRVGMVRKTTAINKVKTDIGDVTQHGVPMEYSNAVTPQHPFVRQAMDTHRFRVLGDIEDGMAKAINSAKGKKPRVRK